MRIAFRRFAIVLCILIGLCYAGSANGHGAGSVTEGEKLGIIRAALRRFDPTRDSSAIPGGVLTLSTNELPGSVAGPLSKVKFKFTLKFTEDPGANYKWDFTYLTFFDWERSGKAVTVTYLLKFAGGGDTGCTESYVRSRGRWVRRTSECFATADDRSEAIPTSVFVPERDEFNSVGRTRRSRLRIATLFTAWGWSVERTDSPFTGLPSARRGVNALVIFSCPIDHGLKAVAILELKQNLN